MAGSPEYSKRWRAKNPDKVRESNRRLLGKRNREEYNAYMREWYQRNREKQRERGRLRHKNATSTQHDQRRLRNRNLALKRRQQGLTHYGGTPPRCGCCGEMRTEFLSLDHINGGGSQHRKKVRTNIWLILAREGWPDGYRILCFNCNLSRGFYGHCPHESPPVNLT